MPGFGQSEKDPAQSTAIDVQGEVFVELLDFWGLDQPLVVAHDFGGAISLRAHLLHNCEFERYILMNVVAMRPWGSEFFDHVGRHVEAFIGLPPHIHRAVVEAYIRGALVNEIEGEDFRHLVEPWITEEGRISFYRQFAQADEKYTAEIEPLYGQVRAPTKIIWGESDPWISLKRGKELHQAMPRASFKPLAGVGHLPQLEAPSLVADAILGFFSG